jgi:hypothetical protein
MAELIAPQGMAKHSAKPGGEGRSNGVSPFWRVERPEFRETDVIAESRRTGKESNLALFQSASRKNSEDKAEATWKGRIVFWSRH